MRVKASHEHVHYAGNSGQTKFIFILLRTPKLLINDRCILKCEEEEEESSLQVRSYYYRTAGYVHVCIIVTVR